ncbi:rho GTPase-activating protein 15 isoform X2 [Nematostella vectensis]|uniref:rho GTPase-activating protein 15 isoform X2 n=1 Tax=Nematostella vectensis TaxID=45351 RepID=UPI00207721A9|nr:rho GTPase-activating protein 15 isoform X2 [Nematostella vectensis]
MALVEENEVEALYPFSYTAGDGRKIAFDTGERFALLNKSNNDWWQVKRNGEKPMYVPANYVREVVEDAEENAEYSDTDEVSNELCNDKLVERTASRESSDFVNNSNSHHIYVNINTNELDNDQQNVVKTKTLPAGVRSLARTLENSGVPLRGSISYPSNKVQERPKSQSLPVGWVLTKDEDTGRPYYYNPKTNETSWKPPRSSRSCSSPATPRRETTPLGWRVERDPETDEPVYINEENNEEWSSSADEKGKIYYYKLDGSETAWDLPEVQHRQSFEALDVTYRRSRSPQLAQRMSKTRSLLPRNSKASDFDLFVPPPPVLDPLTGFFRSGSMESGTSTEETWPPPPPPTEFDNISQAVQKQGPLNRKKIADSGNKKIKRPSWNNTFVALFNSNIVFYRDHKSASQKPGLPHGKPESSCELRGGNLEWVTSSSTRKKNAFQISTVSGLQFLLQSDNQTLANEWFSAIANTITRLNEEDSSVVGSVQEKAGVAASGSTQLCGYESDEGLDEPSTPTSLTPGGIMRSFSKRRALSDDQKTKIKDKLRKLISRRPTIEELEKKGIIREQVFGCPITHLCEREGTTIPIFVSKCINAIESRGLEFDGIYRVCGNVALVQRIRIMVDQEEPIALGESPFDDIHALAGSLKLYFREMPEPLVPFDFFSGFVEAIKQSTRNSKLGALKSLVGQLPRINFDTLKLLLGHLHKVMGFSEVNRMHAQNLAIVWGPNMMRPRYDAGNIAMNMVYQNQIVEFLLLEYDEIFR